MQNQKEKQRAVP